MVNGAGDWPWSSYGAMVCTAERPEWLNTEGLLGQFGGSRSKAVARYRDFVRAGVGQPSIWDELCGQVFLGSDAFIERMKGQLPDGDLREVSRAQRRVLGPSLDDYTRRPYRKRAMADAYLSGNFTMKEIAEQFGVHDSTVSRAVRAVDRRLPNGA